MINDELTKSFEKEFPLPWGVEFRDTAAFIRPVDMPEQYSIFLDTNIPDHIGAVRYAVQCANLMPECVNMLKEADMYMTSMLVGLCNDCPDKGTEMCRVCKLKTVLDDIKTLLAKLEGGETA